MPKYDSSVFILTILDEDGIPTLDCARYQTYAGAWNRRAKLVAAHPTWSGTIQRRSFVEDAAAPGLPWARPGRPGASPAERAAREVTLAGRRADRVAERVQRDAERAAAARAAYVQARRELDQRRARDLTR